MPLCLNILKFKLFSALFLSVAIDFFNCLFLIIIYGLKRKIIYVSGTILGVSSIPFSILPILLLQDFLKNNEEFIKRGVPYVTLLTGIVFFIRGFISFIRLFLYGSKTNNENSIVSINLNDLDDEEENKEKQEQDVYEVDNFVIEDDFVILNKINNPNLEMELKDQNIQMTENEEVNEEILKVEKNKETKKNAFKKYFYELFYPSNNKDFGIFFNNYSLTHKYLKIIIYLIGIIFIT
jgi:hypothetical protein